MVDESYMRWAKARGYYVNVWTVDDENEMKRLLDLGVDGIITNRPELLKTLLR
jgi:glycerophosphoryl diester phosphodiesterase